MIQEHRFGKLTGRTFQTGKEFMAYIRAIKQQREEFKQPREVKE